MSDVAVRSITPAIDDIIARLQELKNLRAPWEPLWKDINNYVLPRKSFWDLEGQDGKRAETKIYDSSGLISLLLLVDGLQGALISAKLRWFRMLMEDSKQQDLPGVADWLEEVDDVLYSEFARSNFYEAIGEFFTDAASVGTAVMFVEDDVGHRKINFSTRHMKECYIAEGRNGMVDVLYREFKMGNRAMAQTFGRKLSDQRLQLVKDSPFGKGTIIHACFERMDLDPWRIDAQNMKWASLYVDKECNTTIDEGGYEDFPYLALRWRKNSDEVYGRSPAADAINDILRANQMGKTMLMAGEMSVLPPLNVPKAMKGLTKIIPRGENYYTKSDEVIAPINLAQNYPIGLDQENAVREQIREAFRTKIFLLMEQLEKGPYTATEIRERMGEKAAVMGPMVGRLYSEAIIPLLDRVYKISERNGRIPPPPLALAAGGRVRVEMQGPLAQSQKQYHELQGVNSTLQFVGMMSKIFPNSMDNVDEDELMRRGMNSNGAPQRTIRELPVVGEIRRKKAEAAAAAQQQALALENQKTLAGNVDKLNQPLNPNSMLAAGVAAGGGQG